jgi:sulfatase maturation enzyme AslB (radical SAM superfamily)
MKKESNAYRVVVDTNGIDIMKLLSIEPTKLSEVYIGLDGSTAKMHEIIRGHGTFRKTIGNISLLITKGYNVSLTFTANNENIREIFSFIRLAESLGVSKINIHTFSEEGNARNSPNLSLSPQRWIETYKKLEDTISTLDIWYPPTWAYENDLECFVRQGYRGCLGTTIDRLSVFPDSKAYICSLLFDYPLNFMYFAKEGISLNTKMNEYGLFVNAKANNFNLWEAGCPAERIISNTLDAKNGLVSICRCWKKHIANCRLRQSNEHQG